MIQAKSKAIVKKNYIRYFKDSLNVFFRKNKKNIYKKN